MLLRIHVATDPQPQVRINIALRIGRIYIREDRKITERFYNSENVVGKNDEGGRGGGRLYIARKIVPFYCISLHANFFHQRLEP